jgi:hypothetical protein
MWGIHKNHASGVNPIPLGCPLWGFSERRTAALRRSNNALVTSVRIPWLTADERAGFRRGLETSMRNARDAVQSIEPQTAVSPILQALWGKLIVLTAMTESDLKTTV